MGGFTIDNLKLPTAVDHACNKGYVDNNFLNRLTGGQIGGDLDMRGHSIKYQKLDKSDSAAARVAELNSKVDKSDLDDYFKLDGTRSMAGNLNMNNNRIFNIPSPIQSSEPTNKEYISKNYLNLDGSKPLTGNLQINKHRIYNLPSPIQSSEPTNKEYISKNYLDLRGENLMDGDLRLNGHRIIGLSDFPAKNNEVTNKLYVDNSISKAQIKPSHIPKNALKYIMDDIDQTSSEYGIEIDKIDNLEASFHSYNKRVIYLKLLKDENDYVSRIGYNIYQFVDKSKDKYYTAIIEWLTTDNNVWNKMEIYNNITSGSIVSNQTEKFVDDNGVYYTRSIVQFRVLSITTPPVYLLSSIHIDGVNPTYPAKFSEVYNIIYGCNGKLNHIDPDMIYDNHQAYEIDKTKMKMLVPLDMNNNAITNIKTPINDSDAVNKKYVDESIRPYENTSYIYIYGMVDRNKFFTISSTRFRIDKLRVDYIRFTIPSKYRGMEDAINIKSGSILSALRYPIEYSPSSAFVSISINQYFDLIEEISMDYATNIPFQLLYSVFY